MKDNALRKQEPASLASSLGNERLKSSTRYLLEAISTGTEPRDAAKVDFGIETEGHFEALSHAVLNGKITPEMLDASIGNGEVLTHLVRNDKTNPHQGIVFRTGWHDLLRGRIPAERADGNASIFGYPLPDPGTALEPQQEKGASRGR
jgi:hypothetical protein